MNIIEATKGAYIEINESEWNALKAGAARTVNIGLSTTAFDDAGRELGYAYRSGRHGFMGYRATPQRDAIIDAYQERELERMAAEKEARAEARKARRAVC